MAAGIVLQFMSATETLTCRLETSGAAATTASCVVSRRILFGLVPIGTEAIAGVRAARSKGRGPTGRGRDGWAYHVVLDAASGDT